MSSEDQRPRASTVPVLSTNEPPATEVQRSPDTPLEVILLTENRDEAAILGEMRGEIADSYVYSFQQGNRTITSLAYAGVKEAVRRRGNVAIVRCDCCKKHYHVEETTDEYRATVKIHDLANNVQFLGVSTCRKTVPFAYVVAANKAERNALRKILPEKQIALLIAQWAKSSTEKASPQSETGPVESQSEKRDEQVRPKTSSQDWLASGNEAGDIVEEPIFHRTEVVGTVRIDDQNKEYAFIPTNNIRADSGPIRNFLVSRVLSAEKTKYGGGFDYAVKATDDGTLEAIRVRSTEIDQDRLRKLLDAIGWAFQKSSESKT